MKKINVYLTSQPFIQSSQQDSPSLFELSFSQLQTHDPQNKSIYCMFPWYTSANVNVFSPSLPFLHLKPT